MAKAEQRREKTYLLVRKNAPITYTLRSRDTKRSRLLYYDKEAERERSLRYARNMKSPFLDEQDEDVAILESIVIEDGVLIVGANNTTLQHFLEIHPDNKANGGHVFYEFDAQKEAEEETKELFAEADALSIARDLSLDKMLAIARIYLDTDVEKASSQELKRDILLLARRSPFEFIEYVNDPELDILNTASRAFEEGYVILKGGKDIYYNLQNNKKKIRTTPFDSTPVEALSMWLKSNEGLDFYQFLQKDLSK
jgi:hypothetical protein